MDNNTDYRMVKLIDGSTIMGSITVDKDFLRITNALELQTVQRHTEFGVKDDSSSTITSFYSGSFKKKSTKNEFLNYIG